jgi:F-type H+-transporting ATPase subunit epsilon
MIKKENKEFNLATSGGFVEFNKNEMVILADTAEMAEEIDLTRAEDARKRAEEAMQQKASMDETDYARVAAAIERESARVRVAKKHHSRHGMKIN